jgi:hypothetical protein
MLPLQISPALDGSANAGCRDLCDEGAGHKDAIEGLAANDQTGPGLSGATPSSASLRRWQGWPWSDEV